MGEKWLFSLVLALVLALPFASAHGIFLMKHNSTYVPGEVAAEFTAINYWGGVENMITAITLPPSENSVWIIPIPSKDAQIREYKGFPQLYGPELKAKAEKRLAATYQALFAAQIYPLPYLAAVSANFSIDYLINGSEEEKDVINVAARSVWSKILRSDEFEPYFKDRKIDLDFEDLKSYVSKDYSFAVAWIPNSTAPMTRSLYLSFETDIPYYPLKLSRYYDKRPPTWLYVVGDVTFTLGDLNRTSVVTHHFNSKFKPQDYEADFFFNNRSARAMDYNSIFLNPNSPKPEMDLWFSDVPERNSAFLRSIVNHPILWGLIVYVFLSCIASMIAGYLSYPDDNPKVWLFFMFGLSNVLTLIGFWTRAYFKDVYDAYTDKRSTTIDQWVDLTPGKRVAMALPVILLILTIIVIPITILLELDSIFLPLFTSKMFVFYFIPVLVFLIMILWGAFHQKQVLKFNLIFTAVFFALLLFSFMGFAFFF